MKQIKVLAVDDDIINLKLLKSMLMKLPNVSEVLEAKNGEDGLKILKSRTDINLILLDIIMPIMNGIEMLKIVRSDESLSNIPVIVLTTDETKKSEALECGANDFIMKPVREKNVSEKIARLINI
ncbi:MAG: response regulator [Campylobacterales bacterium]|nr:response regulator [Campylobacterales bacterium]